MKKTKGKGKKQNFVSSAQFFCTIPVLSKAMVKVKILSFCSEDQNFQISTFLFCFTSRLTVRPHHLHTKPTKFIHGQSFSNGGAR